MTALGRAAPAQPHVTVRLFYASDVAGCPTEGAIRSSVASRLGYDPFDSRASTVLRVTVIRGTDGIEARIALTDLASGATAQRVLASRGTDCTALTAAFELAVSIAIDPFSLARAAHAAPASAAALNPRPPPAVPGSVPALALASGSLPTQPRIQNPSAVLPMAAPRAPVAPPSFAAYADVGARASVGTAPSWSPGLAAAVGLARDRVSLAVEALLDLPASRPLAMGGVLTTWLAMGALVPCYRVGGVAGCALLSAGALHGGTSGLAPDGAATTVYSAVGGRLTFRLPVSRELWFDANLDLLLPTRGTTLRVSERPVWETPALAGSLGIELGVKL